MRKILLILFFILILISPVSALNLSKDWSEINKTLIIKNNNNLAATIELVSISPGLTTFEETFNLTAYVNYTFDDLKDFKTRWNVIKGKNNITKSEWYILKNVSYDVVVNDYGLVQHNQTVPNITSYTNITSTWDKMQFLDIGTENSKLKYKFNFSHNGTNYTDAIAGFDYWNVITSNPLKVKIFWNETEIIGNHTEQIHTKIWNSFNPSGKSMVDGNSYIFKLIYTKRAELGDINILTLPMFFGFEEQNMTWWNSSWNKKAPIFINNTGNNTTLTDFQVNLNVTWNSSMNVNFSDLRIVNETSGLEIPLWNETIVVGSYANIWFNATSIPASSWLNDTYFLYYNSSSATSASNGVNTFIFFDDFSSYSGWNGDTASFTLSGTSLVMPTGAEAYKMIYKTVSLGQGASIAIQTNITQLGSSNYHELFVKIGNDISTSQIRIVGTGVLMGSYNYPNYLNVMTKCVADTETLLNNNGTPDHVAHTHVLKFNGSTTWEYLKDGISIKTQTDITDFDKTYIVVGGYSSLANKQYWDYVFIRKLVITEPTAQLGTEESNIIIPTEKIFAIVI